MMKPANHARILGAVLTLAAATVPAPAAAQPPSDVRAAAVEMFDAAKRLLAAGQVAQACAKFSESYRLDPQLGALLHLADCYERDSKFASAYAAFRDAAEVAGQKGDSRQALAEQRSRALEPRLSRLTVEVPAERRIPGLDVRRDDVVLAEGSWGAAIAIDPGSHRVSASAPGRSAWSTTVEIPVAASSRSVEIPELAPLPAAPAPTASASERSDEKPESSADPGGTQRVLGFVTAGAGAVGVGLGVFFMMKSGNKLDERDAICPSSMDCEPGAQDRIDALTDEADSARTASVIAFAAGGAALVGGVVLVLTAPSAGSSQSAFRASAELLPGGGALRLRGAF